ncbi:MAG: DUF5723 family protein [Candidatus Neomarinimicrobiota bacterium]|nr:DUF5723 family protein [Candidatus Neomarinimicrobiota bacterium]
MKSIYPSLLLFSIMFAQNNPIQTATAGAFRARSFGNHAIQNNPAFLGKFGEKIVLGSIGKDSLIIEPPDLSNTQENDSNIVFIDSLIKYYSVQLIANPNRKMVKKIKKEYLSKYGRGIHSVIIADESMYKFRVGDFLSRDSVNLYRDSLISSGYDDAWVVTSNQPLPLKDQMTPYFTMTIAGLEGDLGNNTLYPEWINNQLFGGLDLRGHSEKENFLSIFNSNGIDINFQGGLNWLNFGMGNLAISMFQPKIYSSLTLPKGIMDVLFNGLQFDQPQDLSNLSLNLLSVAPLSLSYGRQLQLPALMGKVDKFYVGAGINILLGITDIHLESDDMYVSTSSDSIFIKGENSLITNIDNDQNINFGNGFSIDLGVAASINPKINVSLAMQNLFGSITWPKTYTNFHEFSISIASDELEDISDYNSTEMDSLTNSFTVNDTTYNLGSRNTKYPGKTVLSGSYKISNIFVLDLALSQYLKNDYFSQTDPKISIGLEISSLPKFPIYLGMSTGGLYGFTWGCGFSLNLGGFQWNVGVGENGGFLDSAKGVRFSTEFRLIF